MEPDVVTNQPKINKNTFKIGSGDLQEQVANNTKRIAAVSVLLRSNRRNSARYLTPTVSNLQETLAESNLILADIAIQLQQDFDSQEQKELRLLQKNKEEQLELKRTKAEENIEYQKTEKKITKSTKKIKGPLEVIFNTIKNIVLLFGGLVLIKTLLGTQVGKNIVDNITSSEKWQQAKATLDLIFDNLKTGLQAVLVVGGAILGMKLVTTLATIAAVGKGFIAVMSNPIVLAGLGVLIAMGMQGLGRDEKDVMKELEKMGGFSKENRDKLIERLKAEKEKMIFTNVAGKAEADRKIRFLEEGKFGYGSGTKEFDWENYDKLNKLSNIDQFMLNFDPNYNPSLGMVGNNNNNNVTTVELPGETIDLRKNQKVTVNNEANDLEANKVAYVNSVDVTNRYVSEFPITAGFSDSIYA